jgi:hypothetical protein
MLGALAAFAAHAANAGVYFDSVNVTGANTGADGANDSITALAQSFTTATPDFSSITLSLLAATPSDGGSIQVFLVPDSGTGGGTGLAGTPAYSPGGPAFSSFTNAHLIGTVADAALTTTPSLVSLWVGAPTIAPVTTATSNQEYWVALVLSGSSSGEWEFNSGAPGGLGSAGQAFFNNFSGTASTSLVGPGGNGAYDMIVATPEPMTIAVLGIGLAGLGYVRRRSSNRS